VSELIFFLYTLAVVLTLAAIAMKLEELKERKLRLSFLRFQRTLDKAMRLRE
jgi:hypothetical protein